MKSKMEKKNDSIFIQQQFEKEDLKTNIRNQRTQIS